MRTVCRTAGTCRGNVPQERTAGSCRGIVPRGRTADANFCSVLPVQTLGTLLLNPKSVHTTYGVSVCVVGEHIARPHPDCRATQRAFPESNTSRLPDTAPSRPTPSEKIFWRIPKRKRTTESDHLLALLFWRDIARTVSYSLYEDIRLGEAK